MESKERKRLVARARLHVQAVRRYGHELREVACATQIEGLHSAAYAVLAAATDAAEALARLDRRS